MPRPHQPSPIKSVTTQRLEGDRILGAFKRRKVDKDHDGRHGPSRATTSTPFSHDEYTVGWICALPLEMAAAKAMLDEIHPTLPNLLDDHNTYTLGKIGAHNVVVACMPSGVYGTTSAVTVATSMRSSYRLIRVGLMVGIGGGAPGPHADIRLGDVVVSKPNENFGGVVQYDYGKTIQEGIFKRIGTLNKPPQVLLTAISHLQADHRLRPSRIPDYLSEIAVKYPPTLPDFAYCSQRQDQLFEAQYEHNDSKDTCEHCDPGRLVTRPPRPGNGPVIHYGLIASGNQVMKHGRTRDQWARELSILCFEMEAAGLMDHFPCLVIRGICDYADSHKNKQWQEYAAATAAAYAKEVLSVIPTTQVTNSLAVTTSMSIQLPIATGAAFNSYQDELDARCHPDTRVDLLRDIYKWAEGANSECIFWLNGMAGTGKSTVSRTVAQTFANRGRLGGSFFFKRGEQDRENAKLLFPTIAHDLFRQIPTLRHHIHKVIDDDPRIADRTLKEQFDKLIFQPLIDANSAQQGRLIFVIDALDECDRDHVRILLSLLRQLGETHTRVFLTSRPELPIRLGFAQMGADTHLDVILHDIAPSTIQHDISVYLKDEFARIRNDHQHLLPPDQPLAPDWPGALALGTLAQLAVPLFIVAATIARFVGDLNGNPVRRLDQILRQPIGQRSQLEQTYHPVLSQIFVGVEDDDEKDKIILSFRHIVGSIILLVNPLSAASLARLLDVEKAEVDDRLRPLHSVLWVSSDPIAPVHLLHLSFREFLVKKSRSDLGRQFTIDESTSHRYLADKCLARLQSADGLRKNICHLKGLGVFRNEIDKATIDTCIPQHVQYSCRYWVYHIQHGGREISDGGDVDHFLRRHFFHWLECMSLLDDVSKSIGLINILQSLVIEDGSEISVFLKDARRFVLTFASILAQAPLQVYGSAWHFSPLQSTVRYTFQEQRFQDVEIAGGLPDQWSACLQTYRGHSDGVYNVVFSPDGSRLASGSEDNTVRVWDIQTGECQFTLEGHSDAVHSVAFSPDGSRVASGSEDNTVRVWDVQTGECQYTLKGHSSSIESVVFLPDGSRLASGSSDGTVEMWDVQTGECRFTLNVHSDPVRSVALSPDGSRLVSALRDNTVRVWDVQKGECQYAFDGHSDSVYHVEFSPDGSRVASALMEGVVDIWDIQTGECQHVLVGHDSTVICVVFSPDGLRLASGSEDKTVRVWDVQTGECQFTLEGHSDEVNSVVFSPDGSRLASAGDPTVLVWNTQTGERQHVLEGHTSGVASVVFSPDGLRLASCSYDETVRVWDMQMGSYQSTFNCHSEEVTSVAFSPDGSRVASGSNDKTVRVWDVQTGECLRTLKDHNQRVEKVIFSPNGSQLVSSSWLDHMIRVWNVQTGECQYTLEGHSGQVDSLAFSPDGSRIASGSGDGTVQVWDTQTGDCQRMLGGRSSRVKSLAFSPDGSRIASGSGDGTVQVWDTQTRECQRMLKGHSTTVSIVVFAPDGSRIASGSQDKTVRVWDVANGVELLYRYTDTYDNEVKFNAVSTRILVNGESVAIPPLSHTAAWFSRPCPNVWGRLGIKGEWIIWASERILWLPPEYRPSAWASHNDVVVIGTGAGRITFVRRIAKTSF